MNKSLPTRKSIRLKNYDYSTPGCYFVTICTQKRKNLFGEIIVGEDACSCTEMRLNEAGQMIQTVWKQIPPFYSDIQIHEFVIMPNHIHGIIEIKAINSWDKSLQHESRNGQPQGVAPTLSLPDIIHRFKTMTTTRYIHGVKQYNWLSFSQKLWQRNYWEHIIRNELEFNNICKYIQSNPQTWDTDALNCAKQYLVGATHM